LICNFLFHILGFFSCDKKGTNCYIEIIIIPGHLYKAKNSNKEHLAPTIVGRGGGERGERVILTILPQIQLLLVPIE
jgi:hypothetical protein